MNIKNNKCVIYFKIYNKCWHKPIRKANFDHKQHIKLNMAIGRKKGKGWRRDRQSVPRRCNIVKGKGRGDVGKERMGAEKLGGLRGHQSS